MKPYNSDTMNIVCDLPCDLERDSGVSRLEGESDEQMVRRLRRTAWKGYPGIRPCPRKHGVITKWWCLYKCEHLVEAHDQTTGDVIPADQVKGRDVVSDADYDMQAERVRIFREARAHG